MSLRQRFYFPFFYPWQNVLLRYCYFSRQFHKAGGQDLAIIEKFSLLCGIISEI